MKKKLLFGFMAVVLVAGTILTGCAAPAPAEGPAAPAAPTEPEVINWTMQAWGVSSPLVGYFGEPFPYMMHALNDRGWARWIGEATNGRLQIKVLEGGSVFPTSEALPNMRDGVVDCCMATQGWYAGTIPECYVAMCLPFTWPDAYSSFDNYFVYKDGALKKLMDKVYAEWNLYWEPVIGQEVHHIITMFPCNSAHDIAGRKIRIWGANAKYIEALGGAPVSIPYGDVYMALKLGTVEGSTTGALALTDMHLNEVARGMVVEPRNMVPVNALLFNKDSFDALPEDIQRTIRDDTKLYIAATSGMEFVEQRYAVALSVEEYGMETYTWTQEDCKWATERCKEVVWPFYGGKSPRCQEVLDLVISYMDVQGLL